MPLLFRQWSITASANNTTPPDGFPENMAYSNVNNAAREIMAVLARWRSDTRGTLSTSLGNGSVTYSLSTVGTYSSLAAGDRFSFVAVTANAGGAVDLGVVGITGKVDLFHTDGTELQANAMATNGIYDVVYDGTQFQLLNPARPPNAALTGGDFDISASGVTAKSITVNGTLSAGTVIATNMRTDELSASSGYFKYLNVSNLASSATGNQGISIWHSDGGIQLRATTDGDANLMQLDSTGAEEKTYIKLNRDDSVQLRFNDSIKFATTTNGVDITGTQQRIINTASSATSNISIAMWHSDGGMIVRADAGDSAPCFLAFPWRARHSKALCC